ncbi:MAG: ribonuclease P protein component [Planctomycetaceae bacterium]|nr:ribonuclease P protein component [Planctomycetaceae bacterium]
MSEPIPRLRFQRHQRMVRKGDFQRAYANGARARGDQLVVVAAPNGLEHARLGLSVGKAIWKGAAQRNRVRRMFREAFRLEQQRLPAGYDLVLIPGKPKLEPEMVSLRAELVRLARKAAERQRAKVAAPKDGA